MYCLARYYNTVLNRARTCVYQDLLHLYMYTKTHALWEAESVQIRPFYRNKIKVLQFRYMCLHALILHKLYIYSV